jgi:glycine/D-amino acid oxidase-like deaminating enzyme/nitrite reductase/ring-hydroxylating ferredoxin subunit
MRTNGATESYWMASATMSSFESLPGPTDTEICVIGGGIAGLTSAYLLARAGRKVVLIEAMDAIGGGETGRTTAHFMPPDDRYFHIEKSFGAEGAVKVAQSCKEATDLVEEITRREGIDCDFVRLDGYLYCLPGQDDGDLEREATAAGRAGAIVERLPRVPGWPFETGACVRFSHQAQFHPLRYLAGLADACVRAGVRVHCGTRALDIQGDADSPVVSTSHGDIRARAVVVATNTPFNDRVVMHTKQAGYRTYVVGIEVPRASIPQLLLWDMGDPYYYVRLAPGESTTDILIVGGADHKVGQEAHPERSWLDIERWVRERFPMAGSTLNRWSGQVMEPSDPLAFFGRNPMDPRSVFIITGDSGTGMTNCTAGAMAVTDMILGRTNTWADIYDPARKMTHGLGEFVKEQANTLSQYKDLLTSGDVSDVEQILPGQGAVVRQGASKLAVYRDDAARLHVRSAICTHLGCVVAWNPVEKSWDCPCHASRFDVDGEVLHGPAASPLPEAKLS